MTELGGNALFLGPDEHRRAAAGDERLLTAAGRPAPGVEVRLGADEELLVRASQVQDFTDPHSSDCQQSKDAVVRPGLEFATRDLGHGPKVRKGMWALVRGFAH